ncbi:hypothetical protein IWX49DRAFT_554018 [Phyllosticta citricarpa]
MAGQDSPASQRRLHGAATYKPPTPSPTDPTRASAPRSEEEDALSPPGEVNASADGRVSLSEEELPPLLDGPVIVWFHPHIAPSNRDDLPPYDLVTEHSDLLTRTTEARRRCALNLLSQMDLPQHVPDELFEEQIDAEVWVAAKAPLACSLPAFRDERPPIVYGAALRDVTQILKEMGYLNVLQPQDGRAEDMPVELEAATKYRRSVDGYAQRCLKEYVQESCEWHFETETRLQNAILQLAIDGHDTPSGRYRAFAASAKDPDFVKDILQSMELVMKSVHHELKIELADPGSDLFLHILPDPGYIFNAAVVPMWVRIYIDQNWWTADRRLPGRYGAVGPDIKKTVDDINRRWLLTMAQKCRRREREADGAHAESS